MEYNQWKKSINWQNKNLLKNQIKGIGVFMIILSLNILIILQKLKLFVKYTVCLNKHPKIIWNIIVINVELTKLKNLLNNSQNNWIKYTIINTIIRLLNILIILQKLKLFVKYMVYLNKHQINTSKDKVVPIVIIKQKVFFITF